MRNKTIWHPISIPCPICSTKGALFSAVHHKGPPCPECKFPFLSASGKKDNLKYKCVGCGYEEDVGEKSL